jgi:hypothetical protein
MPREVVKSVNLDANESVFFARELESIKARSYDVKYPELKGTMLIPVSTDAGPGAESITYHQFDSVGVAKIIANYADDLPRADVLGKEFTSKVRGIGASYGYNLQEVRAAAMAGKPLQQRRANAARRANDQTVNNIAWFGDATHGLLGLLNNPNITAATAPNGTGGFPQWTTKTAAEILADLNNTVNGIISLTKGVEVPDTVLLPVEQYTLISTKQNSTASDTTVLQYFLRNQPIINRVEWVNELKDVATPPSGAAGPVDCLVVYKRDPDKLTLEIPQAYEQLPVQERNLEFVVPVHSRCGGVIIYYPLSVSVLEDV